MAEDSRPSVLGPEVTLSVLPSRPGPKEHALYCVAKGWSVLPLFTMLEGMCACGDPACLSPAKHPERTLVHNGLLSSSKNAAQVAKWFNRPINYGIRTGHASGFIVIDIDDKPHDGRDGRATWQRLLASHSPNSEPYTVEAVSGSGGRHILLACPPDIDIPSNKDGLGSGIDVKGENGYIVGDGSLHACGREYFWDAARHPEETAIAPIPEWLMKLLKTRAPKDPSQQAGPRIVCEMAPLEREELRSALASLSADDRDDWVQIGMALHATNADDDAFPLWDHWSRTSRKYNEADAKRVWRSFSARTDGLTIATLYKRAHLAGWQRPTLAQLALDAGVELPTFHFADTTPTPIRPLHLEAGNPLEATLPGVLNDIVDWSLSTAPRPQRAYSVAAALAIASTVCGRRFATIANNYSTLHFLVLGKSGTGKEHVRQSIEVVLRDAGYPQLIGANQFTSAGAVWSALIEAPQSACVIDEFGKFLEMASGMGESAVQKDSVLTTLMELWGRVHGVAQEPQRSTGSLTDKQREQVKRKLIANPAMVVVGLATPDSWYRALKSARVASGMLNRYCMLQGDGVRKRFTIAPMLPVPSHVLGWVQHLLAPRGDLDILTRLMGAGDPKRLDMPSATRALFETFDDHCMAEADRLESMGLGELPMRSGEQAMRLALNAALSEDAAAQAILPRHATWGIDVSRNMLDNLVPSVSRNMVDSEVHANRNKLIALIEAAGERGVTVRELGRSPALRGIDRFKRENLIKDVVEAEYAEWKVREHEGPGRNARILTIRANAHDAHAA